MRYLGIDTSNYTTSAALYAPSGDVRSSRRLLPVKEGQMGLRQSDAVFHHTAALPEILGALPDLRDAAAVGVSDRPRDAEGSYMPCFLAGVSAAAAAAKALGVPLYRFSHQAGHIAAALLSADRTDLMKKEFLAFHVSGGTTECVRVSPEPERVLHAELLLSSLDLKAGQAVDRVGVMLGFPFPAGKYVDEEARKSSRAFSVRVPVRDGCCSLSGLENQCARMHENGESAADICRYCLVYLAEALTAMADYALQKAGSLPLVFSGGVTANTLLRATLGARFDCVFASPELACDNAVGTAYLAYRKHSD
jgi:N6-L-threonylcarbamoyladenine synthase